MEERRAQGKRRRFVNLQQEEPIKVSTEYPLDRYRVFAAAVTASSLPSFSSTIRKTLDNNHDRIIYSERRR
ncbi:MAG: hypothetical protein A4E65_02946 [Syntrophorhabdus sp. PtaU1.Bin153]|nr:MAG: hypothetical protein A4E65_02946 [Syntrophorhabdus sp. PtaU1.Bin153]